MKRSRPLPPVTPRREAAGHGVVPRRLFASLGSTDEAALFAAIVREAEQDLAKFREAESDKKRPA